MLVTVTFTSETMIVFAIFAEVPGLYADCGLAQRYGETWRSIHRMIHNVLNVKAAVTYAPYQDLENKIMLKGFLDEPDKFLDHVRRFTFSLSTQIIFGYRCPDMNDPNLKELFIVRCSAFHNISGLIDTFRTLPTGENWQPVEVLRSWTCFPSSRSYLLG